MCPSITQLPRPSASQQLRRTGSGCVPPPGQTTPIAAGAAEPRQATASPMTRSSVGGSPASTPGSTPANSGTMAAANGRVASGARANGRAATGGSKGANGHAADSGLAHGRAMRSGGGGKPARQLQPAELVAGKEVVGRRLSVWWQRPQEWVEARIKEFDASTGQNPVSDRPDHRRAMLQR